MSLTKIIKLVTILIICTNNLFAQNIQGIVTDALSQNPISYVQILNKRTNAQAVSDTKGRFQILGVVNDTLQFSSVGYYTGYEVVSGVEVVNIKLSVVTYNLNQVDVYDKEPIPQIYKSEVSFDEKPKLMQKLTHPISFLYYRFSKREKAKLKVRNMMEYERKMTRVMAIYNKELLHEFTGWTGEKLDDCFMYCNSKIELCEGDDEFSVKYKVLELITFYRKEIESK